MIIYLDPNLMDMMFCDEDTADMWYGYEAQEWQRSMLRLALSRLHDDDRMVLDECYFGRTRQVDVAKEMSVTQTNISLHIKSIIRAITHFINTQLLISLTEYETAVNQLCKQDRELITAVVTLTRFSDVIQHLDITRRALNYRIKRILNYNLSYKFNKFILAITDKPRNKIISDYTPVEGTKD